LQITSAADSEAVTYQKLVKGHAYSVTGAEEVTADAEDGGPAPLMVVAQNAAPRSLSLGSHGITVPAPARPDPAPHCPLLAAGEAPGIPSCCRVAVFSLPVLFILVILLNLISQIPEFKRDSDFCQTCGLASSLDLLHVLILKLERIILFGEVVVLIQPSYL
jgi:hypothetical protein